MTQPRLQVDVEPVEKSRSAESGTEAESVPHGRLRLRMALALTVVLAVLLVLVVPPLVNVSRFQRRITANIGAALGRPVHMDRVSLTLLPLPAFTLENFVVDEGPAFGAEPVLRAAQVRATLRLGSLWRRRFEFSKISLDSPSVNLVHTANGRWNLQSVLEQASHVEAAPTAQRYAGPAPRFPYIEATSARLNLKLDQEKTPFSLTDADFALWLPEPHQWHVRLEAHPVRTDTAPADSGIVRLEAVLGGIGVTGASTARAPSLAEAPIDLQFDWRDVQLGALSRLVLARDAGVRGELTLTLHLLGTLSRNEIAAHLSLAHARRADFVPPQTLSVDSTCTATAAQSFHAFPVIECHWPPPDSSDPAIAILAAAVPDVRDATTAYATLTLPGLPTGTLLDWLRLATPHPPNALLPTGTLAGSLTLNRTASDQPAQPTPVAHRSRSPGAGPLNQPAQLWSGEFELSGAALQSAALGPDPLPLGDVVLRSTPPSEAPHSYANQRPPSTFNLLPITIPLGSKQDRNLNAKTEAAPGPRQSATVEGTFGATGYTLHLSGTALPSRLFALADAVPQFGDGLRDLLQPPQSEAGPSSHRRQPLDSPLDGARVSVAASFPPPAAAAPEAETPMPFDLVASRPWGATQQWRLTTPSPVHTATPHSRQGRTTPSSSADPE